MQRTLSWVTDLIALLALLRRDQERYRSDVPWDEDVLRMRASREHSAK